MVTSGTLFSGTHVPLSKWLSAFCILTSSPAHVSARKLHIELNTSYQTAWTMAKKIQRCLATADRRFGVTADAEGRVLRAIRAAVPQSRIADRDASASSATSLWAAFGSLGLRWSRSMKPSAAEFIQPEPRLQASVNALCANSESAACVLLISEKGLRTATHDGRKDARERFDEYTPVAASCLSKPITATLLATALASHHISFDSEAYGVVEKMLGRRFELLRGVKLHQLLTHTHGLDAPIMVPPRTADGRIDADAAYGLIEGSGQISVPTENLFSYGSAGLWIASVLTELAQERPYAEAVADLLPTAAARCRGAICPATGGELTLNAVELASIVASQFESTTAAMLRTVRVGFAGWSPLRFGAHMGWFDHGAGWLGHNGQGRGSMIMVRFHPERRVGIVITSNDDVLAGRLMTQLFRKTLPELMDWPDVQRIPQDEIPKLNLTRYEGEYANAVGQCIVSCSSPEQLSMAFEWNDGQRTQDAVEIHPARLTNGHFIFMMIPNLVPFHGVIQFLRPLGNGQFRFIWDGRRLWRNLAVSCGGKPRAAYATR